MRTIVLSSVCAAAWLLAGCANNRHSVVAATATTIGLEVGTHAGTGTPTSVLGYRRAELAVVPTNRADGGGGDKNNVKEVAPVMMELRYGGSNPGAEIYQRLAVGEAATKDSAAAALLFGKAVDGKLDAATMRAAVDAGTKTIKQADALTGCVVRGEAVDAAALKKITDRALADPGTQAAVRPYAASLAAATPPALGTILLQSGALADALARHRSDADCVR